MAGRRPKPTAVKKAQGTYRPDRAIGNEPTATTGTTAPKFLDKIAKAEWLRVMRAAKQLGTITKLDRGILTVYCQEWSVFVRASKVCDEEGLIIVKDNGDLVRHPAFDVADKAAGRLRLAAQELGFTPSARSKVHGDQKPKQTDFEKFQSQGGIKAAK